MRDAVGLEIGVEGDQVEPDLFGYDMDRGSGDQDSPQVAHEGVEAETGVGRHHGLGTEAELGVGNLAEGADVTVGEHTAFRRSRGSAGIEEDDQVFGLGGAFRLSGGKARDPVGRQDGAVIVADERFHAGIGNQHAGVGVAHHEMEPFLRVGGVEGLVGAARLDGGQRSDGHEFIASQDDGDYAARFDVLFDFDGEMVGETVQLCIAEPGFVADQRGCFGRFPYVFPEEIEDGFPKVDTGKVREELVELLALPRGDVFQVGKRAGFLHRGEDRCKTLGELAEDLFGILLGLVPETDDLAAVGAAEQFDGQTDARRVGPQVFGGYFLSVNTEGKGLGDELTLVAETDAGVHAQIARTVGERVEGAGA